MPFNPKDITKEHVLKAIEKIETESIQLRPSTGFDVIVNGKAYPPKEVMRYANQLVGGELVWNLGGGEPTNKIFRELGFEVIEKKRDANFLTGVVMKLGCNWGTGAPSFYSLIKERGIVISTAPFEVGHLVAIAEGFTVKAIARVQEEMDSVANDPSLEEPFDQLAIGYDDSVCFGKAEWYELPEDDVFEYRLTAGIREVQDRNIKDRIQLLWKNRNKKKQNIYEYEGRSYRAGSTGAHIINLQKFLIGSNYYTGFPDGVLSQETRNGIVKFQLGNGLPATGNLDHQTWQAMKDLLPPTSEENRNANWLWKINNSNFSIENFPTRHSIIVSAESDPTTLNRFALAQAGDRLFRFDFVNSRSIVAVELVNNVSIDGEGIQISCILEKIFSIPVHLKVFQEFISDGSEIANPDSTVTLFPLTEYEARQILDISEGKEARREIIYNELKRPKLDNDEAFAPQDYLGFEKDIRAFAALMAMKDMHPPLAIALFGQWGAGKSFFMHHLKLLISHVSKHQSFPIEGGSYVIPDNQKPKPFCEGIVQITFNAWSYLDSNLWAGLVTTILEKLDKYISNHSRSEEAKRKVLEELSEKLVIVSDQKQQYLEEVDQLQNRKETIETQIQASERDRRNLLITVKERSLKNLREEALKRIEPMTSELKQKLNEYGITQDRLNHLSPERLYEEITSWSAFLGNVLKFKPWDRFVLIAVIIFGGYLIADPFGQFSETKDLIFRGSLIFLTAFGPSFMKIYNSFRRYKQLWQPIVDLKNKFNQDLAESEYNHQMNLQLLKTELLENTQRQNTLEKELVAVNEKIKNTQYAINNSITRIAFNNFILERRGDLNYEKHLGIISTIRRDFETISELFHESINEATKETLANISEGNLKKGGELRQYFEKPLDRIILYIDDLDRCPDDKVIDVLQAVHLLMAFPLFIVVVGVDKRCVQNALIGRNILQYQRHFSTGLLRKQLEENGISVIEPNEYLEKIFQIPFHLDEPAPVKIKEMVQLLLRKQIRIPNPTESEFKSSTRNPQKAVGISEDKIFQKETHAAQAKTRPIATADKFAEPYPPLKNLSPDDLLLSEQEYDCLVEIISLVSKTPRTIKRFINLYRIIRAHELLSYDKEKEQETYLAIMLTVALATGDYKDRSEFLFDSMKQHPQKMVKTVLGGREDCRVIINQIEKSEKLKPLLSMKCQRAADCIQFTRRFSFGG